MTMADPIRVVHFADVHVGMENYGRTDPRTGLSSRVVDFVRRMDDITAYAQEHDADLIIFAGDAFKTRSPNPTFQREFAHRINDMAKIAPVVLLTGNHDVAPAHMKASSVEIYEVLNVPNVWVAGDYAVQEVETKRGPVVVGTAPYPIRSRVLNQVNTAGMTIAQIDSVLQEQLATILDEMAAEADQFGDIPRLLTGHFTISGAVIGSERGIMLGRDVAVARQVIADPRWDYVAMGHIHKHQNITADRDDLPPVVYSGSLERIDFGEEGDPKGFCWVDLARNATQWRFQPLTVRPFVTVKADLREDELPTQTLLQQLEGLDLKNAVVRLLLDFSPESEARFNEAEIRQALNRAQVFYIAVIRKQIEQPNRMRLGTSPEGLTNMELLERYLISTETPEARRADLLEMAADIMSAVENND
jgi:DNA repair protein SbcD/Mre11